MYPYDRLQATTKKEMLLLRVISSEPDQPMELDGLYFRLHHSIVHHCPCFLAVLSL